MAVARDDTGLGHLRDVNPVALTDVKAQGTRPSAGAVRNPEAFVFGIEPVFKKSSVPAYPAGREEKELAFEGVRAFVAPN